MFLLDENLNFECSYRKKLIIDKLQLPLDTAVHS